MRHRGRCGVAAVAMESAENKNSSDTRDLTSGMPALRLAASGQPGPSPRQAEPGPRSTSGEARRRSRAGAMHLACRRETAKNSGSPISRLGLLTRSGRCPIPRRGLLARSARCLISRRGLLARSARCPISRRGLLARSARCPISRRGLLARSGKCPISRLATRVPSREMPISPRLTQAPLLGCPISRLLNRVPLPGLHALAVVGRPRRSRQTARDHRPWSAFLIERRERNMGVGCGRASDGAPSASTGVKPYLA
jgi:hypothetical protein